MILLFGGAETLNFSLLSKIKEQEDIIAIMDSHNLSRYYLFELSFSYFIQKICTDAQKGACLKRLLSIFSLKRLFDFCFNRP